MSLPSHHEQDPDDRNNYYTRRHAQPARAGQSYYTVPSTAVTVADQKEGEPVSRVASAVVTKNSVNSYYQLLTTLEDGNIGAARERTVVVHHENEQTTVTPNLNSIFTGDTLRNNYNDSKQFYAPSSGRSAREASFTAGNTVETKSIDRPALTKKDIEKMHA